jgi:hypothetical protein
MRKLLPVLAAVAVIACGSDSSSSTGPQATIAGTWTLQTINGQGLPFIVVQNGSNKTEVVSDVVTISGTGSYTQTSTIRVTTNGVANTQSSADAGTYTLNGTAVAFHSNSDGSTTNAAWSGNTLTVTDVGLAAVYKR